MSELEQPVTAEVTGEAEPTAAEYRAQRESGHSPAETQTESETAKPKGGFQRRIDQLTKDKRELERRLETAAQPEKAGQQFETIEEYSARVIREAAERERTAAKEPPREAARPATTTEDEQRQQEQFRQQHGARAQVMGERWRAAVKADPELEAAVKASTDMVPAVVHLAMTDLPNGHEVAIFLAKRPEFRQRLTLMWQAAGDAVWQATQDPNAARQAADVTAIREIHRIGNGLQFSTGFAPRQQVERPVTKAPTPITPLGGSGDGVTEKNEDDMSPAEYRRSREKSRNPRRG